MAQKPFYRETSSFWAPQQLLKQEPVYGVFRGFRSTDPEATDGRARLNLSERTREWQRMFEAGEVATRAELARRVGVSRARVTQVLGGRRI